MRACVMEEFNKKLEHALAELKSSKKYFYGTPRLYKFLWKYEIKLKPAQYENFWVNIIVLGASWAIIFGIIVYLMLFIQGILFGSFDIGMSLLEYIAWCAVGALLFGLPMALFAAYEHWKLGLSKWEDLG